VAGDGVARAGAQAELVALAETLGAAVHGEPIHRRLSFPGDHALWRGGLYPTSTATAKALERFDVVLVVGANVFTWLFHAPGAPGGAGARARRARSTPRRGRRRERRPRADRAGVPHGHAGHAAAAGRARRRRVRVVAVSRAAAPAVPRGLGLLRQQDRHARLGHGQIGRAHV